MAHTFAQLYFHLVFSTKHREKWIDADLEERLHAYMGGILRNLDGAALTIGGVEDHAHILAVLRPKTSVAEAVNKIKANSTDWVHKECPARRDFAWQTGYGAFTVSRSNLESVRGYIDNQKQHHRTMTFEEEFLALLEKHGIDYDKRFVLD